jgi:phosphoglycerate dehydrogenase-like enzyme
MNSAIALLPRIIAPLDAPGVEWYEDEVRPDTSVLERVGFFVPRYLGSGPNANISVEMPRLEVIQLLTIGYDYATKYVRRGVTLCNAQGVHEASTAELTLGLIIASLRGIDRSIREGSTGIWNHQRGESLQSKRVLIIGAGPVGRAIESVIAPMGASITMVAQTAREDLVAVTELPNLLPHADVVVLAVPLTPSTSGMVDAQFLSHLKTGSLLVNVARGSVVVTSDLVRELESGRIRAALDVTDPEPLPIDHVLWSMSNVVITPHVGGDSDAFPVLARALIARQIHNWRTGASLENVIHIAG